MGRHPDHPQRAGRGRRAAAWRGVRPVLAAVALLTFVVGSAACDPGPDEGATPPGATGLPEAVATVPPTAVSADVALAVQDAAESGVNRWPDDEVTVSVDGSPTGRDSEILDAALVELGALTGLTLQEVPADGEILVRFAPKDQWRNPAEPNASSEPGVEVAGLTRLRWDSEGRVSSATVDIDADTLQTQRNRTIVHELMHALGLDHVSCPSALLSGAADAEPTWVLSDFDAALLETWYRPALPAGTPAAEVPEHLITTAEGPSCPTRHVDARLGAEGALWCERVLGGAQPCLLVDGLGEAPTPPFAPDRWLLDDVLYDHDPDLYEVIVVEGRRTLCELGGTGRRPCQYTDGPGPLTDVDAWYDGQFVYDSP